MASLITGYQRDMLERKHAFGIVAIKRDDSWHCVVYDEYGRTVSPEDWFDTEELARKHADEFCAKVNPDKPVIQLQ